jgi:ABC-type phosphate transport system substrate-binding protein
MTFVRHDDCLKSGLPWANMVNKAGKVVAPSVYSVQAAMAEFAANFSAGDLTIDIVDAPGNESWPLAYTTFIAINRSITALDCTNIEELMHFIAWTQINDGYPHAFAPCPFAEYPHHRLTNATLTLNRASVLATSSGSVPIDESLRKNVLDLLTHVQCNGERALAASYLIGAGPPLPVYTAWTVAQSTTAATIKYFEAASSQAKQQLLTFDEQFGATSNGLEAEWYSSIPDVALVPATIYAIVPAFHLRELDGLELVLDFETIAAIYLAEVTQWNDARIKAINSPVVANALPAKPIVVVTQTTSSAITHLFTTMLSAQVAAFAAQVTQPSFPFAVGALSCSWSSQSLRRWARATWLRSRCKPVATSRSAWTTIRPWSPRWRLATAASPSSTTTTPFWYGVPLCDPLTHSLAWLLNRGTTPPHTHRPARWIWRA